MRRMKIRKNVEIKARVDGRTKAEIARIADRREVDVSDILREAIRDLLKKDKLAAEQMSLPLR